MPVNQNCPRIIAGPGHCMALLAKVAAGSIGKELPVLFRRDCHRWALNAPAALRYKADNGERIVIEASVQDLSGTGIGLRCHQAVPSDILAEVFVSVRNQEYSAAMHIVHVTVLDDGYRIGCEYIVRQENL